MNSIRAMPTTFPRIWMNRPLAEPTIMGEDATRFTSGRTRAINDWAYGIGIIAALQKGKRGASGKMQVRRPERPAPAEDSPMIYPAIVRVAFMPVRRPAGA